MKNNYKDYTIMILIILVVVPTIALIFELLKEPHIIKTEIKIDHFNYTLVNPEFEKNKLRLTLELMDVELLEKTCANITNSSSVFACSSFNYENNRCTVYIPKVDGYNETLLVTWGHELMHCVYGAWHNGDNKDSSTIGLKTIVKFTDDYLKVMNSSLKNETYVVLGEIEDLYLIKNIKDNTAGFTKKHINKYWMYEVD